MKIGSIFLAALGALTCTLMVALTAPLLLFSGCREWRLPLPSISPTRRAWSADERRRRLT